MNYWLLERHKNCLDDILDVYLATEFIDGFDIKLNVRLRNNDLDEWIRDELKDRKLVDISNIFYLQSYGKLSDDTSYSKPIIVQNIDDWFIYSSDGKSFYKDLIARSEYEKTLK